MAINATYTQVIEISNKLYVLPHTLKNDIIKSLSHTPFEQPDQFLIQETGGFTHPAGMVMNNAKLNPKLIKYLKPEDTPVNREIIKNFLIATNMNIPFKSIIFVNTTSAEYLYKKYTGRAIKYYAESSPKNLTALTFEKQKLGKLLESRPIIKKKRAKRNEVINAYEQQLKDQKVPELEVALAIKHLHQFNSFAAKYSKKELKNERTN